MSISVVTGANRGIGLALAQQLEQRGRSVVAVCRKATPELESLGVRVEPGVDVADAAQVSELAKRLGNETIDLLINNAGILESDSFDSLDLDRVRRHLEINSLGPLRVTHALAPRFENGTKVAIITSLMGSMGDNGSGRMYAYRMSKAAVNAAGVSLARDLSDRGVAVALLHPGYVQTDMTGGRGNMTVDESAAGLLQRIDELTLESSGTLRHANGDALPW